MTRDEMIFDANYGYWFNLSCERFYRHIDFCGNFVQLVGGSSAALAAVSDKPNIVVAAGLALAVSAAISLLVQPSVKAELHSQSKGKFVGLRGKYANLTDDEFRAELTDAQRTGLAGIGALATPAFNATLRATGREDAVRELAWLERIADVVA